SPCSNTYTCGVCGSRPHSRNASGWMKTSVASAAEVVAGCGGGEQAESPTMSRARQRIECISDFLSMESGGAGTKRGRLGQAPAFLRRGAEQNLVIMGGSGQPESGSMPTILVIDDNPAVATALETLF